MDSKKVVYPGQRLTVEEEYEAGKNTFADEEGNVIATSPGEVSFNEDAREVHVTNTHHNATGLEVDTVIVGRVSLVKDAVALINIGWAEKNGQRRQIFDSTGALGVARASRQFIRSMHDLYQVGDFVRARVSAVNPYSIELSTNDKGFGKILSREQIVKEESMSTETFPAKPKKELEE